MRKSSARPRAKHLLQEAPRLSQGRAGPAQPPCPSEARPGTCLGQEARLFLPQPPHSIHQEGHLSEGQEARQVGGCQADHAAVLIHHLSPGSRSGRWQNTDSPGHLPPRTPSALRPPAQPAGPPRLTYLGGKPEEGQGDCPAEGPGGSTCWLIGRSPRAEPRPQGCGPRGPGAGPAGTVTGARAAPREGALGGKARSSERL